MAKLVQPQPREHLTEIALLRDVQNRGVSLDFALFGRGTYSGNLAQMQKPHYHSNELPVVNFRPATTAKAILALRSYPDYNESILNPSWLQAGYVVRTANGVFTNPPKDAQGNPITDEKILTTALNGTNPVRVKNGALYIVPDKEIMGPDGKPVQARDFAFVEYGSFFRGVQGNQDFLEGGLARALEHTEGVPPTLAKIASTANYPQKVDVFGFNPVETPALRVASLGSYRNYGWLGVGGYDWFDNYDGFAFGVRESGEASTQKI